MKSILDIVFINCRIVVFKMIRFWSSLLCAFLLLEPSSGMVVQDLATSEVLSSATAKMYRANQYGSYSHGTVTFEQVSVVTKKMIFLLTYRFR